MIFFCNNLTSIITFFVKFLLKRKEVRYVTIFAPLAILSALRLKQKVGFDNLFPCRIRIGSV